MRTSMTDRTHRSTFEYACPLVAFFLIAACSASAVAGEISTLYGRVAGVYEYVGPNGSYYDYECTVEESVSAEVTLKAGEVLVVRNHIRDNRTDLTNQFTEDGDYFAGTTVLYEVVVAATSFYVSNTHMSAGYTLAGPAVFRLKVDPIASVISDEKIRFYDGDGGTWDSKALVTIEIIRPEDADGGLLIPRSAVVIPADAGAPVDIFLESSEDMVNWTPAEPGTYGTTTRMRFFRVRGERVP